MTHRKLTEIWIYPIKSLPGIRVKRATVKEKGLEGDRRMMLVDANNRFITQRELPELALLQVSVESGLIQVSHRVKTDHHPITIDPTQPNTTEEIPCVIFDDTVLLREVSPMYSNWFSKVLDQPCKLMLFPEDNARRVDEKYVAEDMHVSLADGYPYLIIGNESLKDLNKRVGDTLPINRFRPNFFFEGGLPYEEDTWKDFFIGAVKFRGVKPCGRCTITTINPATAEKSAEPLKTLATYRNVNGKVLFGQNVIAMAVGTINEGDDISIYE